MASHLKPVSLIAATLAFSFSGCTANRPMPLNSVVVDNFIGEITAHPLYAHTDKFSFSTAATRYPANNGYHTVPVGNYLLLNVLNALPSGASDVRLLMFSSDCKEGRIFLPNVICSSSYIIAFQRGQRQVNVDGKVITDVGLLRVKDADLLFGIALHRDYGDGSIVAQVKLALDDVVRDFQRQLVVK